MMEYVSLFEPGVPSKYTQIEYLKSSGTQRVGTGVLPTKTTEFELSCSYNADSVDNNRAHCIFGMRNTTSPTWRMMITSYRDGSAQPWDGGYFAIGNDRRCQSTEHGITDYIFSYKDGVFSNGHSITEAIDISNDTIRLEPMPNGWQLFLFAGNFNGGVGNATAGKIYYCKLWQDKVLVRNLIPVRRNSDGVLGFYDTVDGEFLTNDGTGVFVAGPEVPTPSAEPLDPASMLMGWLVGRAVASHRGKREPVAYLYNGVRLPPLPEWDKETYPYAFLGYSKRGDIMDDFPNYMMFFAKEVSFEYTTANAWGVYADTECEYYRVSGWGDVKQNASAVTTSIITWANFDVQNEDGTLFLAASDPIPVYE